MSRWKQETEMNIENHFITTVKTAKYSTLGYQEFGIKKIWFVLHGYGQLAEDFIKLFELLVDEKTMVVAPEALNHFYKKGFSGEVGASWMTKTDRGNEIKDYLIFLNNVYSKVTSNFYMPKIQLNVLGFSQGAATAIRWIMMKKVIAENVVLCGSRLPKDIDLKLCSILSKSLKLNYFIGAKDDFVSQADIEDEKELLKVNKIDAGIFYFNGGHEVNSELISIIKEKYS